MLVACIALVLALGGSAWAAGNKATIGTSALKTGAVTTAKLADGSVTRAKLASKTLSCPPATIAVGPACVEADLHAALGQSAAIAECAAQGRRLPFVNELLAVHSLGIGLGDPELVADDRVGGNRREQSVLTTDGRTAYTETLDTARRYRCVAGPTP
ncbi:MAG: hypothetical protein QOI10_1724 [Solirubrobacterales bacterium]|jgi:hypothetical protein|nr:hypothetical protein [Solirubrobacterales bacterium]